MSHSENAQPPHLNQKQIKYLRGLGHKLTPLVLIGKEGLNESVITAVKTELLHHELIKVKIGTNSSVNKQEAGESIPQASGALLVQLIGKTLLLYKPNPKRPKEKRIKIPNV